MANDKHKVKSVKFIGRTPIQDKGFRGLIKNILEKNDLKSIIYNVEDGNVNIFIWGDDNDINSSLEQIQKETRQKDMEFEPKIEDLSVNIPPPSGIFIVEDTEKDKERKFDKGIELLTDIGNRIQGIEKDIENALINIKQDKISNEWNCNKVPISKEGNQGIIITTNNIYEKRKIVKMRSELEYVKIYDIKLILKYNNGQEISDDAEIIIQKQKTSDSDSPEAGYHIATCKYEDLKRKFILDKEIKLYFQESIVLYLKKEYIQDSIQLEDILFTVDICTNIKKEKEREEQLRRFGQL